MREENLHRLTDFKKNISDPEYLVYKYYINDLLVCFEKYVQGKLFDIGCGNKPFAQYLKPFIKEYKGCDIIQSSERCVDVICEANNIPEPSASYDTVISTQTIEHVEDHQGLVDEAFRILKPEGYFILSGPMYWPLHEEPYDFFRFTKYGFKYILEKSGFEIIETKSNGGKWALCGQVIVQTFYPEINTARSLKGKVLKNILRLAGGIKTINKFFSKMDDRIKDEKNTMNYVIVAKKNK